MLHTLIVLKHYEVILTSSQLMNMLGKSTTKKKWKKIFFIALFNYGCLQIYIVFWFELKARVDLKYELREGYSYKF